MRAWFLYSGIVLCLFSLGALVRQDWVRLVRPRRKVLGRVIGHRAGWDDGHKSYAAVYRFAGDGGEHEVVDPVYTVARSPDVGVVRELVYPAGRPDLARPPRLAMWLAVYGVLLATLGLLGASAAGWIR